METYLYPLLSTIYQQLTPTKSSKKNFINYKKLVKNRTIYYLSRIEYNKFRMTEHQ